MKLPVFHKSKLYKDLFVKMDTEYTKTQNNTWTNIEDNLLDKLLNEGEIEISSEEINNYLEDDGYFRVQGKTVILYIRDQYQKYYEFGYKYHIYGCKTILKALNQKRKSRYVFKSPSYKNNKGDSSFIINLMDGRDQNGKNIIVKNLKEELNVCKNCLKETDFKSYSMLKRIDQKPIYENFDYKDFFDIHESYRLANLNFQDYKTAPINSYTNDWIKKSKIYRESKNWTCESCNINLSEEKKRKFLHTHHIDSSKVNNSNLNLMALCIECHSKKPKHEWIKNNPDYKKFKRVNQLGLGF